MSCGIKAGSQLMERRAGEGTLGGHLGGLPEGGNKLGLKDEKMLHDGPWVSSGSGVETVTLVSGDGGGTRGPLVPPETRCLKRSGNSSSLSTDYVPGALSYHHIIEGARDLWRNNIGVIYR